MKIHINSYQKKFICYILKNKSIKNKKLKNHLHTVTRSTKFKPNDVYKICNVLKPHFSRKDIKNYGITFTPLELSYYMYKSMFSNKISVNNILNKKIADLSSGNGSLFVSLFFYMKKKDPNFSLRKFIENNIFAYEKNEANCKYLKLIFVILVEYFGEDSTNLNINIKNVDTIKYYLNHINSSKFDLIIGNPPYVKYQNLNLVDRHLLKSNFLTTYSTFNLYYVFIELASNLISKHGIILYLVSNYLLKIKSAKKLRKYLINNKLIKSIIDFKSHKVFGNVGTYSMILELKKDDTKNVNFLTFKDKKWKIINNNNLNDECINLLSNNESKFVKKVSGQPKKLDISTGIATLKDKDYLVSKKNNKYIKLHNGKIYNINPELVVQIVRGSKSNLTNNTIHYIIYPYYRLSNKTVKLIPIREMKTKYLDTYKYLCAVKEELLSRSGKYSHNNWYKYGRNQSLNRFEHKIVYPTNTKEPRFRFINFKSLFYNGYAIYGLKGVKSTDKLLVAIKVILNSRLTKWFMDLTSYCIGDNYVSYQKKYLQCIHLPNLNLKTINKLNKLDQLNNYSRYVNDYVFNLYGLDFESTRKNLKIT